MKDAQLDEVRLRLEALRQKSLGEESLEALRSPTSDWARLLNLDEHPEEAAELAELLNEAAPKLGLVGYRRLRPPRGSGWVPRAHSQEGLNDRINERVLRAVPMPTAAGCVDWSRLAAVVSSEALAFSSPPPEAPSRSSPGSPPAAPAGEYVAPTPLRRAATPSCELLVQVNSGGCVFFCLFEPPLPAAPTPPVTRHATPAALGGELHSPATPSGTAGSAEGAGGHTPSTCGTPGGAWGGGGGGREEVLILKFVPSRLLCQSEQFASELARQVGICAPDSRVLRHKEEEWAAAAAAAERVAGQCPALRDEMARCGCALVLEFVPGAALFASPAAFEGPAALRSIDHLGRLFCLDMLLGNADRLPCDALGWRGNPANLLFASVGRWAGRPVAIDAVVQRRPPGGLMSAEDSACERLVELALNDGEVAGSVLREAVAGSPAAAAAAAALGAAAVAAFQAGLRSGLEATSGLKGLLEMMFDKVSDWISEFLADIERSHPITPRPAPGPGSRRAAAHHASHPGAGGGGAAEMEDTLKIRAIAAEASQNEGLSERVAGWKSVFRGRCEELRHAVEEWQAKRGVVGAGAHVDLSTGFLDGAQPVVDLYELKVRLEHMLQRLRVLQQATATARPTQLLPRVYLSGAVEASSMHILRHLGITHILNATEDLLLPEPSRAGLAAALRIPLRDVEEEDLAPHFAPAAAFIDAALAHPGGGGVLVHCHAGRSRSCSLVLAWLMTRRRWTLRRALLFLQEARPQAAPNAGYMACLLVLEEELFGRQTVKVKNKKPAPKCCPECGEVVGLSAQSVRLHLRLKHPGRAAASRPAPSAT